MKGRIEISRLRLRRRKWEQTGNTANVAVWNLSFEPSGAAAQAGVCMERGLLSGVPLSNRIGRESPHALRRRKCQDGHVFVLTLFVWSRDAWSGVVGYQMSALVAGQPSLQSTHGCSLHDDAAGTPVDTLS